MDRRVLFVLSFWGMLCIAGCGGSFSSTSTTAATSSTITSVNVTCNPSDLQPGQSSQCSAAVSGTGNYSTAVTWSSGAGAITTDGLYTAPSATPSAGTDTVTATSAQDKKKSGAAAVKVNGNGQANQPTAIAVTANPSSITTAQTAQCTANVSGKGNYSTAVAWTATGGTITQSGVFTPSGTGTGTCTATSTQSGATNVSGSATIAITAASTTPPPATVTSIAVVASPAAINTGQTSQCAATVSGTGSFSNAVTWTATGGTITQSGVFTPSGTGTGTCTATSTQAGYTNISGSASIAVSAASPTVKSVTVTASPASINTGQTSQCTATVAGTGSFSNAVTWTATGGTITQSGVFTPSGTGTGTCIATSTQAGYTNISGSAAITVTAPPTVISVAVAATPSSITTAQTAQCAATVSGTGSYTNAVTWTATGGTITTSGLFTPTAAGTGTCTAKSTQSGFTNISGSANITVTSATPTISSVTLACSPTSITTTQTATCTATVAGTGSYTNTVNLSLSPSSGGSLSASSAVASGTAVTFTPTSSTGSVTVTAVSTQDTTKTSSATIAVTAAGSGLSCGGMSLGSVASLNGFVPFPSSNAWNTDISNAPLDSNNATISSAFPATHLHPDFSSVAGGNYGIPYIVVDSSTQPFVPITVNAYASESDVAEAPVPATAPIEGTPADCTTSGDQHLLVLDRSTCMLYETFNSIRCNGTFSADSETIWDLKNYEQRPWGWTSADAAGLPIFPGLVRYDEVASGVINHAIRFTLQNTKNNANGGYFVQPASHAAGTSSASPFVIGMRIRLKASYDISGFSAANQVILTAMKKYGLILADNGSNFFFQGTPDARWNDSDLAALGNVTTNNFEVVQMTPTYPGWDANTAPTGAAPTINSFTASASTVAAGTAVTLTWSTTNDSYDFIDKIGGVRGPSVTVTPTATTTYTLNATNQYGRSTKQATVVVQ